MHKQKVGKYSEQGVALIAVMLALLLITAIAAGIIILTNTETNTSSNFKDEQRAFFSAKSGLEEARDRLRSGVAGYTLATLPTTLPGNGSSGVLYITNPLNSETVAPWCGSSSNMPITTSSGCGKQYPDDELCNETLSGSSVTCTTDSTTGKKYASGSYYLTSATASSALMPSSGAVLDWKWARITLKQNNGFGAGYYVNGNSASTSQVFWNGNNECTTGSTCSLPVYVITALAVTPNGSRRMVQMEVARDQLTFTAPAALTLPSGAGSNDLFSGGTASGWAVSGQDAGGCGGTASSANNVAAIGVSDGTKGATDNKDTGNLGNVVNGVSGSSSSSGIPNKNETSYTGLNSAPDVENVSALSSYTSSKLDSYTDLTSLVSALKNDVTQPVVAGGSTYSGNGNLFNSSSSSPQIVYVNGDLTVSGSMTGYGILVVTGTLTFKGTSAWNGLIMVVGTGDFETDGTNSYAGAIVVAKTSGGSMGAPTFNVNGGGNGSVNYSAACVANATQLTTYHSVSFRELLN